MKLRDYLAGKAVGLCFISIALITWGIFAYLCGANPVLLWGSEVLFAVVVVVRYAVGYVLQSNRIKRLCKTMDELDDKYLMGELLPKPHDGVERAYFDVMQTVSRSAVGIMNDAEREKEEYCDFVERWIHEIKTPLTACSLICDGDANVVKIKRELKRLDNIADTALYYARLRTPETDNVIAAVDMRAVADDAILSQRELLTAAHIGIDVDGGFTVNTNGKAVGFVLKQLFINCAKYCAGCHINVSLSNGTVAVADNGPGIESHELLRIMQRGFTGEAGRRIGSTGMGLYIASEICKRLGVEFSVSSEYGKGTEFKLKFDNCENITKS